MACVKFLNSLILDIPPSCVEIWPSQPEYFVVGTYFLRRSSASHENKSGGYQSHDFPNEEAQIQERTGSLVLFRPEDDEIAMIGESSMAYYGRRPPKLDRLCQGFHINHLSLAYSSYFTHLHDVGPVTSTQLNCRTWNNSVLTHSGSVHVQTFHTPFAILDIHFSPHDASLLCAATSTGSIGIYSLDSSPSTSDQYTLKEISILQLFPKSTLVLSSVWHPCVHDMIGVTLSTGEVKLCKIHLSQQTDHACSVATLMSHDLEAWTLAFTSTGDGIFSGGDDAMLKYRSLPTDPEDLTKLLESDNTQPDWQDRRIHGAGVTAILPLMEGITVTGSYDDHIRVFSTPKVGRKAVLAELGLGGGVWRLKKIDDGLFSDGDGVSYRCSILASCMHAGVRIVELTRRQADGTWSIEVVAKFEEHKSMNYGSDVQPRSKTVVSTSFYDRLLCLWRYQPQEYMSDVGGRAWTDEPGGDR